tara:strand:- start:634 stop:927 length:294 start_codon:yes stop_codon:yes gene_type:complete
MIGLGRTVEVGGVVYEVIRTIPITSLKEGITDDEVKELAKMYVAEKAFKSETKGEYFFVNEVEDIEWEDIIEEAEKPKEKKKDGKRNTGNTHSDSDS